MRILINQESIAGATVGVVLFSALLASSLFRNLTLAALGCGILFLYFRHGIGGFLRVGHLMSADLLLHPEFAHGLAIGSVATFAIFLAARSKRR